MWCATLENKQILMILNTYFHVTHPLTILKMHTHLFFQDKNKIHGFGIMCTCLLYPIFYSNLKTGLPLKILNYSKYYDVATFKELSNSQAKRGGRGFPLGYLP